MKGVPVMDIYIPYFYIIQEVATGMYYAGSKYGRDANPENFMVEDGYTTSSRTIKSLIAERGLESFIIRKIRIFQSGEEAYDYETRFLRKIDAASHAKFYNRHNNERPSFGSSEMNAIISEKYGDENYRNWDKIRKTKMERYGDETFTNREKAERTNLERYGVKNCWQSDIHKDKIKETNFEKYGVEHYNQTDEFKERVIQTNLEKYGVENYAQTAEYRIKSEETCLKKYGVDHHLKSEVVKEKRNATNLEKYGVECNLHIPEKKKDIAKKISAKAKERCTDPEYRKKMSEIQKQKGKCVHCGVEMNISNLGRYHNNNCKHKPKE